jgi:hypothetical protein
MQSAFESLKVLKTGTSLHLAAKHKDLSATPSATREGKNTHIYIYIYMYLDGFTIIFSSIPQIWKTLPNQEPLG